MSFSKVRWGILGTSYISEVMANAISQSKISEFSAIGSRSQISAKKFADNYPLIKCYANYQDLLEDPEIDAVYIGLPNHLHKEWVIRCAAAKKHILCEKPFVINAKEAEEAYSAVKQASTPSNKFFRIEPFIFGASLRDF